MPRRKRTRHPLGRLRLRFVRASSARRAAFAAGCATLILWGCYCIRENGPWLQTAVEEPPPRVDIDRVIRVRFVGRRVASAVKLRVGAPYEITQTSNDASLRVSEAPLPAGVISVTPGGLKFGDLSIASRDVTITPKRDAAVVVGDNTYRGVLRVHVEDGRIVLTNHVDMESYLRGVLRGELPGEFHPEAFKAQCVAARTYAMYQKLGTPPGRDWDVYDNEGSQMYIGVRGEERKSDTAVAATAGEVAVFPYRGEDKIFCTYYSSTCGGVTQPISQFKPNDPDVPPLGGNILCTDCYLSRYYRWGPVKLSQDEVTRRVVERYPVIKKIGKIIRLRPKDVGVDGRIVRIQLDGSGGENETLVAEDFRLCMGGHVLRSTCMAIENGPGYFEFTDGKGFGHGCGLCQYGMETKALRGMSYREILAFYYPTSTVKKLY